MQKNFLITVSCILLFGAVYAQCPDKDVLFPRMVFLKNSSGISNREQLQELLPFASRILSCPYRNDSAHALILKRIGWLYYLEGDSRNALPYYREAINTIVRNAGKPEVDLRILPGAYYWISVMYDSLHMAKEKLMALDTCLAFAEQTGSIDRAGLFALTTRIVATYDVGDYYRSVEYAKRCETLSKKYADANVGVEHKIGLEFAFISLINRITVLLDLKDYKSAEGLLADKVQDCKRNGFNSYLGIIYMQMAEMEKQKDNYEKVLNYLNLSLNCFRTNGFEFDKKRVLNTIGNTVYFEHYKNYEKALHYYHEALDLKNQNNLNGKADTFENLSILGNIAKVYAAREEFDLAFQYFDLALSQIGKGVDESDFLQDSPEEFSGQKKIYYRINLLLDKAETYKRLYKKTGQKSELKKAQEVFKTTDQILDRIRGALKEHQSKLYWRSYAQRLYEHAIEICYLNNSVSDALYFFEKSRAVLLFDQLVQQRFLNEKDIANQAAIQRKVMLLESALGSANSDPHLIDSLQHELYVEKRELDHLNGKISASNPQYFEKYIQLNAVALEEIRNKILNDHNALIEVFSGDSSVYILSLRHLGNQIVKINKDAYDSLANSYIRYLVNQNLINSDYSGFLRVSAALYQLLFKEIEIPAGRIIISPDGKNFPFESLVLSNENNKPKYFLEDHAVSYAFSARFLLNEFPDERDEQPRDFFGMAPMKFNGSFNLATLIGSDLSLLNLKRIFKSSETLFSTAATRNNFLNQFYKYKVTQLYTHATDSSSRNQPVIYFADSALYLSDLIYENKPATQLIVLSACETARGQLYKGEGVFSFSRGFAALGIPSSISTLWSVNDEATYRLTESFYKYLAEGLPLDIALQKAKLEFLNSSDKEKQLPYFWAGPILAGKSDPIDIKKPIPWKYILPGTAVLFAAIGLPIAIGRQRRRKKSKLTRDKVETAP